MKKMVVLALMVQLCLMSAMAKEYSFTLAPSSQDSIYHYNVDYDPDLKKFSLTKETFDYGLIFGFFGGTTESVKVYDGVPNVGIYHSTKSKNWGGNANELIFTNKSGDFLFGAYVDPERLGLDKRRRSYILVKNGKGVEKVPGCAVLHEDYGPFDSLLALSKPVGGTSATKGKTAAKGKTVSGKNSNDKTVAKTGNKSYGSPTSSILKGYNLSVSDAIYRFMGKIGYDELVNKDWEASFDLVKGSFGVTPYCWTKADDMSKYFIYNCKDCTLLGKSLGSANIYQKEGNKHIHWEYSLDFKSEGEAQEFLGKVKREMEGTGLPLKHSSKDSYGWVSDDYALKVNAYFKKIGQVYVFSMYVYQNGPIKL